MLETLGTMKKIGIEKGIEKVRNEGNDRNDKMTGMSGEILMMRCRSVVWLQSGLAIYQHRRF